LQGKTSFFHNTKLAAKIFQMKVFAFAFSLGNKKRGRVVRETSPLAAKLGQPARWPSRCLNTLAAFLLFAIIKAYAQKNKV